MSHWTHALRTCSLWCLELSPIILWSPQCFVCCFPLVIICELQVPQEASICLDKPFAKLWICSIYWLSIISPNAHLSCALPTLATLYALVASTFAIPYAYVVYPSLVYPCYMHAWCCFHAHATYPCLAIHMHTA